MARGRNKVFLVGQLGRDPEVRYTQSGTAVANFSLATTERRKRGEEWEDHTEWHNIVAWGKQAENCGQYLQKGSTVDVEGRIQARKWQDKEGNERVSSEIVVNDILFLARLRQNGTGQPARKEPAAAAASATPADGLPPGWEDTIPF